MKTLAAHDFNLGVVQVVMFTEPDGFSVSSIMKSFFPSVPILDGDPETIPDGGLGLPPEVPRVVLQSKSGRWRCQIAPARLDVFWSRIDGADATLGGVLSEAARVVRDYRQKVGVIAHRVAVVATRYSQHEDAGLFLARHFCQERWYAAPLNRPESFELHSHKSYEFKGFRVNSWFRAKSGLMTEGGKSSKVVLAEQDLNTLPREGALSDDDVSAFFAVCPDELDHVLGLYFPEVS